jgi:hypothetical protein
MCACVHILSACLPSFLPADFKEQAGRQGGRTQGLHNHVRAPSIIWQIARMPTYAAASWKDSYFKSIRPSFCRGRSLNLQGDPKSAFAHKGRRPLHKLPLAQIFFFSFQLPDATSFLAHGHMIGLWSILGGENLAFEIFSCSTVGMVLSWSVWVGQLVQGDGG